MRRAGLKPLRQAIAGRDQRTLSLFDVACGTGRFLRQVRLAFPALRLTGLDLSAPYLSEAARHFEGLRPAQFIAGNAEAMPVADASQDIVTSVFLFHELPPEARGRAIADMARVLKPGGTLVMIDSLQMGDRPGWDGMLEAFPVRFHEPYFRQYAIDDLDARFTAAGLARTDTQLAFLSKVIVCQKPAA
jgi:ubiquinone/menaquinone biosynthesis C-methylase UbiE